MSEFDESTSLSIVFANTKRKKRASDIVTIANHIQNLERIYGSRKEVADKVGISNKMLGQFLKSLKLEDEVKKMVSNKIIDRVDVVNELSKIKDPFKQISAAEYIQNINTKDIRDVIRLIRKFNVTAEDARSTIVNSKKLINFEDLHIFIIDFNDKESQIIIKNANKIRLKPEEFIKKIVLDNITRDDL